MQLSLVGFTGRIGSLIGEIVAKQPNLYNINNIICKKSSEAKVKNQITNLNLKNSINIINNDNINTFTKSEIIIDFSLPNALVNTAKIVKEHKTLWLVCLTNIKEQELDLLKDTSQFAPIIIANNTSTGILTINQILPTILNGINNNEQDLKISISETHHINKLDSPSGTAIMLKNKILNSLKKPLDINIKSHRINNNPGEHTIKLQFNDEEIIISHQANSPYVFAKGALDLANLIINLHKNNKLQNKLYNLDQI